MNGRWFGGQRIEAEYYDGLADYNVADPPEKIKIKEERWQKYLNEEENAEL
jgi:hypothetical protein